MRPGRNDLLIYTEDTQIEQVRLVIEILIEAALGNLRLIQYPVDTGFFVCMLCEFPVRGSEKARSLLIRQPVESIM